MVYLSVGTIALSAAFLVYGADRMSRRTDQEAFRASSNLSKALVAMAEDARSCVKAVSRHRGVGALFFFPDGSVAVWFDRAGESGVVHRKVVRTDGSTGPDSVVAREVDRLGVEVEGRLITARAASGNEERSITVRRRP
jgi:hypothetical protein